VHHLTLAAALGLTACSPVSLSPADDSAAVTDGGSSGGDGGSGSDGGSTSDGDTGIEHVGGDGGTDDDDDDSYPKDCAEFYDPDMLPTFELDFSAAEWAGIQSDCNNGHQTYRPVTLTYDGETVDAMARLKGNWSWNCSKMQFVVSFNEVDSEARFHGLRKLMFDAAWYDQTILHERLAYPLFEARDLPYSCVNNARLDVNGAYYGLFANLERIDHEYLERHFDEPDGNLYQAGSELKTNEDINDTSRLKALQAARTADEIGALMNLDQAVAEWAVEAMIPALDNYWAGVEINYYLYDHPTRGFEYLPYDMDLIFGDSAYTGGDLVWGEGMERIDPITWEHSGWRKEALFQTVLADPEWCNRYVEELELARAAYSTDELLAKVELFNDQIAESLADDPNRTFSESDNALALTRLKAFIPARAAYIDAWLAEGDHCPAQW
jgi:CotH kinase protein